jgi:hypothetical protein
VSDEEKRMALLPARFAAVLVFGALLVTAGDPAAGAPPDATVTAVRASGADGAYTFLVTIRSNDLGCNQYADWWEVVDEHDNLVYRRVLLHDHADEQPFTRDGGPVAVKAGQTVTVRAHMNTSGYAAEAMRGSVSAGFSRIALPAGYAAALAKKPPLPDGC